MGTGSLDDVLIRVRSLLIDLERHIDRSATEQDLAEAGRAWVRSAQVERLLRSVLPAEVMAEIGEIPEPEVGHGVHSHGTREAERRDGHHDGRRHG